MGIFDDLFNTATRYRANVAQDIIAAIGDVEAAVNGYFATTFPHNGAPSVELSINTESGSLQAPDKPDLSSVKPQYIALDQLKQNLVSRLASVHVPNIDTDFNINSDLTDWGKTVDLLSINPLTKFNKNEFETGVVNDLTNKLYNLLATSATGYYATINYTEIPYSSGISFLDRMYSNVTSSFINHFNADAVRIRTQADASYDFEVRSSAVGLAADTEFMKMNFAANAANLYTRLALLFLDRNSKELDTWKKDKELLIKYEWDRYGTTVTGYLDEFRIAVDNAKTKLSQDIQTIFADYDIAVSKFLINIKATLAKAESDVELNKVSLLSYEAELLKMTTSYKTTLTDSMVNYLSTMYNATSTMNSLVELLSSETPTSLTLKTQKG